MLEVREVGRDVEGEAVHRHLVRVGDRVRARARAGARARVKIRARARARARVRVGIRVGRASSPSGKA